MKKSSNSGGRRLSWERYDPDQFIYRVLDRLPNRRQAFAWGTLFVSLKWISFASSVNDLILQSKPIKYLSHLAGKLLDQRVPELHPIFSKIAQIVDGWAIWWRVFVSPVYRLLSVFRIFHVPEIVVAICTNLLMLFCLPAMAFLGSLVASRTLRAEARRLRAEFENKIEKLSGQDMVAARKVRAKEWVQLYGHGLEMLHIATVLRVRAVKVRQIRFLALASAEPTIAIVTERQQLTDEMARLQNKDDFEFLSEATQGELLSSLNDTDALGTKPLYMNRDDMIHLLDYMHGKHLGLQFSDRDTIDKNLQLLHAQHAINFQLFQAVGLSLALALTAVVLRIIGHIWF